MSEFETLGRDVAASAEASADVEVAQAVKGLWVWAGFDQGENPNHLFEVEWWKNGEGFAVAARVKERNVYAPEVTPAPPASPEELRQQQVAADDTAAVDEVAEEEPASELPAGESHPEPELEPVTDDAPPDEPVPDAAASE